MDTDLAKLVKVVVPGHEEWEERRTRWNKFSETEAKVRVIAVPSNTDDVVKVVNWARENQQTSIGVRAGGHGFFSANEVVIDMRDGFDYTTTVPSPEDEGKGIATIGMGQTLAKVDERTHPFHVPLGVVSHTGCGLMLTGGVGYSCKAHGPSPDNIVEVTIVTSDGEVHTCSAETEPDLFFAVRGAAPNLGVVTEVKAKCYMHPDAFCALLAWPLTTEKMKTLIDWSDQDAVLNDPYITPYVALIPSPDLQAHLVCIHIVCIGQAEEDGKYSKLVGQLTDSGEITLLAPSRVPFQTPQTIFDAAFPKQFWYVTQTYYPGQISPPVEGTKEVVKAFLDLELGPACIPMLVYEQRGAKETSAFHKVSSDSYAQPNFDQRWEVYIFFGCVEAKDAESMRAQGRAMRDVVLSDAGVAGGRCHFTKDEPSKIEFYYGPNAKRVSEVVAKYDPHRLFASCNGMQF